MQTASELASLTAAIPFVQRTNVRVLAMRSGHARCLMPFAGNANHVGIMYAGALFTASEFLGGVLYLASFDTARFVPIVKSFDIRYLKPATGDVTAEVNLDAATVASVAGEAERLGKAEFVLEAVLTLLDGTVVATSRGVYQLRPNPRKAN